MKYLITIISFLTIVSCDWSTTLEQWNEFINPDPIDTVAVPIDSIIIDTCESYTEYTDPAFVGLYIKFDTPQDSILWESGAGTTPSYDLGEVVSQITTLPFVYGSNPIGAWVLIKGTNDHKAFELKVWTRSPGGRWFMGTGRQSLWQCGGTASDFKQNINDFPSFDLLSFYGTDFDSLTYVDLCREALKDCHGGRWYADLYFIPFQLEQSLIDSFYLAGWERVRTH